MQLNVAGRACVCNTALFALLSSIVATGLVRLRLAEASPCAGEPGGVVKPLF